MRYYYVAIVFALALALPNLSIAQHKICINNLDTNKVIRIAKRHNSYWTKAWQCPPNIEYNENNCEWKVSSCKIKISNKGDCKNTNGCTLTTSVSLIIDAGSGKIKDRIELKLVTKNWE